MRHLASIVFCASIFACGGGEAPIRTDAALDAGDARDAAEGAADAERDSGDGDDTGSSPLDASPDGGEDASVPPIGPARYAFGRDHSPLTPSVLANLRTLRAVDPTLAGDVFAKVGDSITASNAFLRCFGGTRFDLAGRDLTATRDHFAAGDAAGIDPYRRESIAAVSGWSAWAPLRASPEVPLTEELDAVRPAFAVVMFGTNDIETMNIGFYGENMIALIDAILARGVIPIVSSIPPRDDSSAADADVPRYSLVARALAEARQIPFIDLERRMRMLPDHGLAPDGVHPYSDPRGACFLDAQGITAGYNLRNLLTLEALDRVRRVLLAGEPAPDPDDPPRLGAGTPDDPFIVDTLPFTDARATSLAPSRAIDRYACAPQDESGPELYYRLELDAPRRVRALVIDRGDVDIDVHHLAGSPTAAACDARNDRELTLDLAAGVHYFALDTFAGDAQAGEYLFTLSD